MQNQDKPAGLVRAVAGIDAAITARHHIAVREFFDDGTEHLSRFTVDPTLAGLGRLSQRLVAAPAPVTAVVEPTSMTWLALASAVERAGGQMEMIMCPTLCTIARGHHGQKQVQCHRLRSPHPCRGDLRPAALSTGISGTAGAAAGRGPSGRCHH